MTTPILYQNDSQSIGLIDLPRSIEDAQASPLRLRSSPAPVQPYPSTEPKGSKLTQAIASTSPHVLKYDREVQTEIYSALRAVKAQISAHGLAWCFPRHCEASSGIAIRVVDCARRACVEVDERSQQARHITIPIVLSPCEKGNTFACLHCLQNSVIFNSSSEQTAIDVPNTGFHIPARSSFILSTIQDGLPAFQTTVSDAHIQFELVLADPPWSNRSVRHARAYSTREFQHKDPFLQTLPILRDYLTTTGVAAIWVTNKTKIRAQVEHSLSNIGFRLSEEWIWVKVTSSGQPVTALDGVWRKPYESILLFRRGQPPGPPIRKYIFAVPDTHSRKPSLKRLFDQILPPGYNALELFARSLTAGWWSWGDEVLKFQDKREWTDNEI